MRLTGEGLELEGEVRKGVGGKAIGRGRRMFTDQAIEGRIFCHRWHPEVLSLWLWAWGRRENAQRSEQWDMPSQKGSLLVSVSQDQGDPG